MSKTRHSSCPINAAMELLGDRWSLLVVRDLMFAGFRNYKQLLSSAEGIATNILADRLEHLQQAGIITGRRDPEDARRTIYHLTAKGMDLAPVLLELGNWGVKHERDVSPPESLRKWKADRDGFLAELRAAWREDERSRKR